MKQAEYKQKHSGKDTPSSLVALCTGETESPGKAAGRTEGPPLAEEVYTKKNVPAGALSAGGMTHSAQELPTVEEEFPSVAGGLPSVAGGPPYAADGLPSAGILSPTDTPFIEAPEDKYAHNRELIARSQGGDAEATELLVLENTGLVRSAVSRFLDRGTEYEDLMQIGTIGMLRAIRSFDLTRGTAFSTYAVPLIVGEIRRHLRDDGIIRVSRSYKKTGAILMRERARIQTEEGREPQLGELAAAAGVSIEEAAIAFDAMTPISSLSESVWGEDSGVTLEGTLADTEENEMQRICDRVALSQAIRKMQPLWRKIVLLRYYRDMTQQQVADNLGLSQVKVSREEKKIMEFLRTELA